VQIYGKKMNCPKKEKGIINRGWGYTAKALFL
jgi:hypothetical protein